MQQHPKRVEKIVLVACVLHNLIRARSPSTISQVVDVEDSVTRNVVPGKLARSCCMDNKDFWS